MTPLSTQPRGHACVLWACYFSLTPAVQFESNYRTGGEGFLPVSCSVDWVRTRFVLRRLGSYLFRAPSIRLRIVNFVHRGEAILNDRILDVALRDDEWLQQDSRDIDGSVVHRSVDQ